MELRLLLSVDGDPREVTVTLDPAHPVGELAAALARHVGTLVPNPTLVRLEDRTVVLDPDGPVGDSGIVSGARLAVASRGATPPAATTAAERFVVTGGPDAGLGVDLTVRRLTVGRSVEADLTVADPFLSRVHLAVERDGGRVVVTDAGSSNGTLIGGRDIGEKAVGLDPGSTVIAGSSQFALRPTPTTRPHTPSRDGTVAIDRSARPRTVADRERGDPRGLLRRLRRHASGGTAQPGAEVAPDLLDAVEALRDEVWSRRTAGPDHLNARIGWSDGGGVTIDLREPGGVALELPATPAVRLASWVVAQLATHQSPEDVRITIATSAEHRDHWYFASWLPHVRGEGGALAMDAAEAAGALRRVVERAAHDDAAAPGRVTVVVLDATLPVDAAAVERLATRTDGGSARVHVVAFGEGAARLLPGGARVEISTDGTFRVRRWSDVTHGRGLDGIGPETALRFGLALAPLREGGRRSPTLPDRVDLLELLTLEPPHADAIRERWRRSRQGVTATIGATLAGPVHLDLGADGSTLLVGPTRSGKTEALAAIAANLAVDHPPGELDVAVIDAAGGALTAWCRDLPHVQVRAFGPGGLERPLTPGDVPAVVLFDGADRPAAAAVCEQVNRTTGVHVVLTARDATLADRLVPRPTTVIRFAPDRAGHGRLVQATADPIDFLTARIAVVEDGAAAEPGIVVADTWCGRPGDLSATSSTIDVPRAALQTDLQRLVQAISAAAASLRADASAVAEPVRRAFLFTDIVDSTPLLEAIGDAAWVALLRWHDDTLVSEIEGHGGEIVDQAGDGFFASFASATDALTCAVSIQRRLEAHRRAHGFAPRLRMGLHADDVLYDGRYRGRGVHVAARIAAHAAGDEVLASSTVLEATGPPTTERRTLTLKGIEGDVNVGVVSWRDA